MIATLFLWLPFGWVGAVSLGLLAVVWGLHLWRPAGGGVAPSMPFWLTGSAGLIALAPAAAIWPKSGPAGVSLSMAIFDHTKIAIVDAIARSGLPPVNAFYGGAEGGATLTYYWWWHGSAAALSRGLHIGGWTADAVLTWFTAYAALMLMAGIGLALSGRGAAVTALVLSLAGSLRPFTGVLERDGWLRGGEGLGAWLNQASWAPQHMASGTALVLAVLVLSRMATRVDPASVFALGCLVATGFGSSTWVGGVTCAVALPIAAILLLRRMAPVARPQFIAMAALAACVALALIGGLMHDEWAGARLRGGPAPVMLAAYPVFGVAVPASLRGALNIGGFPLLLLIEFPALALFGALGVTRAMRREGPIWSDALIGLGLGALLVCMGLRSTIDNNDLGWRAVVPALLALTPFAAAATWRWIERGGLRAAAAVLPALLGAVGVWPMLRDNLLGDPAQADSGLMRSAPAWAALRAVSGPTDRVASNPNFLAGMTLWPANIGWALLADRPSCYSGWATAHALVPVPTESLYRTDQELVRVFAGAPAVGDLADMAVRLHCRSILLIPSDGAWQHDPFAASALYRRVDSTPGWRIYLARDPQQWRPG